MTRTLWAITPLLMYVHLSCAGPSQEADPLLASISPETSYPGTKVSRGEPQTHGRGLGNLVAGGKRTFDFANWPGKGGQLKAGFHFKPSDYPRLSGRHVRDDERVLREGSGPPHAQRHIMLGQGPTFLRIHIRVVLSTTDDAQEVMALQAFFFSVMSRSSTFVWRRGDTDGLAAGDVNLVSGTTNPRNVTWLMFVRNNVFVELEKPFESSLDLQVLGKEIDQRISRQVDLTPVEMVRHIPAFSVFEPEKKEIPKRSGTRIHLKGRKPENKRDYLYFLPRLSVSRQETGLWDFYSGRQSGERTLRVIRITDHLLFATAETTVLVR